MSSRLEDLRDLAQLLDEGKITQREFEVVKTELLEAPLEEWADSPIEVDALPVEVEALPAGIPLQNGGRSHDDPEPDPVAEVPEAGVEEEPNSDPDWLAFAKETPRLYLASLAGAVLSVLFGWFFAPIAWMAVVVSIVTLVKVKDRSMRWMAWTALAVGVGFSLIGIVTSGSASGVDAQPLPNASSGSEQSPDIPAGSLGVEFTDLTERWNGVPDPPLIVKGITRAPEVGVLDSFLYRFDEAAVLAGAYNPSDGYVYALMAKVGVGHESRSSVFVHLCYLLHPGSQECLDAFMDESGVYRKTAEELSEEDHFSSWVFQDHEWRVEVVEGIETIRVLGSPPMD